MPSKAETIAARWDTVLTGATSAVAVYRDRADALSREESPVILIELVDEDSTPFGGNRPPFGASLEQDELRIALIVCVRGIAWQTVADQVRVQAHAVLAGDAVFHAMVASWRRDRAEWKSASADLPFGYCAQTYLCKSLTRAHALDQFA